MIYLQQILSENSERGRLDCAALDIARLHYPDLDPQPTLDQLNQLASSLGDRIRNFNDGREFVEKAQQFLFEELGFRGNAENFYDPLNSCLNQVLERRVGIPITLSVMYMEIARRLHMPVYGIGLPGHFLLQFDDGRFSTYIDPFNRGVPLTARDCYSLANAPVPDPALLRRVTKKQIAMRMLQNLHRVYVDQRDFERAFTDEPTTTLRLIRYAIGDWTISNLGPGQSRSIECDLQTEPVRRIRMKSGPARKRSRS